MRFKIFILFTITILYSCSKEKGFENVKVLGHAATGLENLNSVYHDNSKEGVEMALSMQGCDGVEIDIQISKDGDLWLYHDGQLNSQMNGDGCIPECDTDYLKDLRYGSFHHEKLTRLSELDLGQLKGKELFLDLRHYNECSGNFVSMTVMIQRLTELNMNSQSNITVNCILGNANWIEPFINAGFNVYYSVYSRSEAEVANIDFPLLTGYIIKNKDISKDEVTWIRNTSKKVYIFEVRSPKGIRSAFKKYPDGILTDDLRATLIEKY
jgi:glycerophosphoryl diester phosphodiesterase